MTVKITWSASYLDRKYGPRGAKEWKQRKAQELAALWGSPVWFYTSHGKVRFLPYMEWRKYEPLFAAQAMAVLWGALPPYGDHYATFLEVHEKTGFPFETIYRLIRALDYQGGKIRVEIERNGRLCFIMRARERDHDL